MIINVVSLVLFIIAAIFYGCLWTIQFKYSSSIFRFFKNQQYFDPSISWKNKWKVVNGKSKPKFFGSTTFLVFLTDFFHLCQSIFLNFLMIAISLLMVRELNYKLLLVFILLRVLFGFVFEKLFSKYLVKI